MQLRLTLVDPRGAGPTVDVVVEADPGTPLHRVRDDLLRAVGRTSGRLLCAGADLDTYAVLGCPPLLDGAVLTVDVPAGGTPRALLELHVTAGPDAGGVHRIPPGEHGIGRAAEARLRLDDPDVSRLHAVLRVGPEGMTVHDLGSTNGTFVDGEPVGRDGRPLVPGQALRVGDSRLELVAPDVLPAACRPDGEGHVEHNRPPRLQAPKAPVVVTLPAPPGRRDSPRLPLVSLLVPLVAGLLLVAVTRSPTYLLLVLLSPLMVLGTFVSDRAGGRRSARVRQQEYDEALARAQRRIDEETARERLARQAAHPGAAELLRCATGPRPRLWERRRGDDDFLSLRVGLGDLPASLDVRAPAGTTEDAGVAQPVLPGVPVTVPLREVGVMGVAGPRDRALSVARFALAQLAGWHSPRHLGLVLLVADPAEAADWEWARWLPHLRPVAGEEADLLVGLDAEQVRARVAELVAVLDARHDERARSAGVSWRGRAVVVVLDGASQLRRLPGVSRLLEEGAAVGLYVLCLERDPVALPAECAATVVVTGAVGTRLRVAVDGQPAVDDVVVDGLSQRWAQTFARALAPLRDATPDDRGGELPERARLLDLLGFDATDPASLETAWRVSPRGTRIPLGVGPDGSAFEVDLRTDGPHALVAGTTGSGKSELLQTLVAGLAVANRPDEMAFVLVDYKGGAAFKDCARLPHTVGLVTDLDGHLTERALTSLTAELRRREAVLRAAGCKDIDDYLSSAPAGAPPMPRLVLVVDEFATLVDELPDFVGGLVGIAQRGRSLGVHLVLATQRPGGVVSADIRANTTLRIALRVTDPAESADVVDAKDAAAISRTTPGRAIARIGAGPVLPFQSARVGGVGDHPAAVGPVAVRPLPWGLAGCSRPRLPVVGVDGPTDLARLVDAARTASDRIDARPAASPWLPPLGRLVTLDELPPTDRPAVVPLGLCDLPAEQRRAPLAVDLEHGGHLLVAGGPRSGRSTLLRTLAVSAAARLAVPDLHLYALDGGGGALSCLSALPHCGAVVGRDETARGDRLVSRLLDEVQRRQAMLARAGLGSVAEQRATAAAGERLPWLVLLVDGWEGVQSAYDDVDHGRPIDGLLRLVREGGAAGLRVVVSGDRGLLTSRVGAAIADRLLLRLADPADFGLAGVPARAVPPDMPPGRVVRADDLVEAQVALLTGDPSGPAQVAAARAVAERTVDHLDGGPSVAMRPMRVEPLPARVTVDDLRVEAKALASGPAWVLVGVGGDELAPVGVDLCADGPGFVVCGPPGSGRSTALATMTRWLGQQGTPTVLVGHRRSPLRELVGEPGVLGFVHDADGPGLDALLAGHPGELVVVADDAETLHDTPVERPMTALLDPRADRRASVLLAGSTTELGGFFRGLTVEARRSRCGLLLGPVGPVDGDLFGIRVPYAGESRPGQGLLVVRGRVQPVQVATN